MKPYSDLCQLILDNGVETMDRTGVGTLSSFGHQMRFPLSQGFPLLTLKKTHFKSIAHELLWFLKGDTNVQYLKDNNVSIWNEWAKEDGSLGPVYGYQWIRFGADFLGTQREGVNQIQWVVDEIKKNPSSRRLIVSAWNPVDIPYMALAPCHVMFQFHVSNGKLSCQLYQRSADMFLGVPFNIASYALLTHMVAQVTGLEVGDFIHTIGDAHIYLNHVDQTFLMLSRDEKALPSLTLNPDVKSIFDFKYSDFTIAGYDPHPAIKAAVAV